MSNAIESWSWDGCSGKKAQVEVYARADRVELFINGKSVGSKKMKNDCRTSFDVIMRRAPLKRFRMMHRTGRLREMCSIQRGKKRF